MKQDEFLQLCQARYSCRNFKDEAVDLKLIERIICVGSRAPSACNLQPFHILGIGYEAMKALTPLRNWYGAPAMILGCKDLNEPGWVRPRDSEPFMPFDLGLAMVTMAYEATSLGLNSCFIASFDPGKISANLGLKDNLIPYIALVLGKAADEAPSTLSPRKEGDKLYTLFK